MRKSRTDDKPALEEEPIAVAKSTLLPRTGESLPIPKGLVGCTQALFYEYRHQTTSPTQAVYCLKPYDHEYKGHIYKSMYLIYMTCDSEYEAAIKLVGNYAHWLKLRKCSWFIDHLEQWNEELSLREAALAKSKLVILTEAGNVTAARTLLGKPVAPVGKPKSKGARKDDATGSSELDDMLARAKIADDKRLN